MRTCSKLAVIVPTTKLFSMKQPDGEWAVARDGGFDLLTSTYLPNAAPPWQETIHRLLVTGSRINEVRAEALPRDNCFTGGFATDGNTLARVCKIADRNAERAMLYDTSYGLRSSIEFSTANASPGIFRAGTIWLTKRYVSDLSARLVGIDDRGALVLDESAPAGRMGQARCASAVWSSAADGSEIHFLTPDDSTVKCPAAIRVTELGELIEWPYAPNAVVATSISGLAGPQPPDRLFVVDRSGAINDLGTFAVDAGRQGYRLWAPTTFGLLMIEWTVDFYGVESWRTRAAVVAENGDVTASLDLGETPPLHWSTAADEDGKVLVVGSDGLGSVLGMVLGCAD